MVNFSPKYAAILLLAVSASLVFFSTQQGNYCPPIPLQSTPLPEGMRDADALAAFGRFSKALLAVLARQVRKEESPICATQSYGKGEGAHDLCPLEKDCGCHAITYGVQRDWSFETALGELCCKVFAHDPSVNYKAGLDKNVYFHKYGAPNPPDRVVDGWVSVAPPQVARMLVPSGARINVLKMDCDNCEYMIYPSVVAEDPEFFKRVDQFSLEAGITNNFMRSHDDFMNYARLLALLERDGLELVTASLNWCGPRNEATGCPEWLAAYDYPCEKMHMCHNFLFARKATNLGR